MTKDEALKLALEALEEAADAIDSWGSYASGYFQVKHDLENDISKAKSAITAIKAALLSRSDGEAKDEKQKPVNIKKVAEEHGINLPTEFVPKHDESKAAIQSLTDQCAALIWERDELQKQMWRSEKQEPVAHSVVAGALFDFMGWLTSREKRLILSSVDEASPAVEAITEFAKKRNLSLKYAEVGYWMEFLSTPPQREAKDEPWEKFCDSNCVWTDHHPDCKLAQRTWVGLTPQERDEINEQVYGAVPHHVAFHHAIEAKLKEKNT